MTLGKRIGTTLGIASSALVLAGAAGASNITVVRDVAARDARRAPVQNIQVVRDVSSKPVRAKQPAIKIVRDTPARDAAQAKRQADKAIAYFRAMERSGK